MHKPLIGVTCGVHHEQNGSAFYGSRGSYIRAVEAAGGLPLLIVPLLDQETLHEIYQRVDGVLLTGGGDVDPERYGLPGEAELRTVEPDRDATEINITRWAAQDNKPLLGVCRGIQVMNVAMGGTLYQDIATEFGKTVDHDLNREKSRNFQGHDISIRAGSRLASVIGETHTAVNTMHHQAIRVLGDGLTPVATSPDGLIEGVEKDGARFFVGVQWHPEELYEYSEPMRRLFGTFVEQSSGS